MKSRFAWSLVWKIKGEKANIFFNDTHFLFYTCNIRIYPVQFSGIQTYASIPVNLNSTFIGHTDDVGDIDYNDFMCKMDAYKLGHRLDVGEQQQQHF
jgi:hypothetical protein